MSDPYSLAADRLRLDVLDSYDVLDSGTESGFEDVVLLARQICDVPVALVSLVAGKRQWFKAASGVALCETPIEQSVCAHALTQTETFVIPDLTRDERTKDNALVTGEPYIRFYAGALLRSPEGVPLGTVCVIDTIPRPAGLTEMQRQGLEALARQMMLLLELRKAAIDTAGEHQRESDAATRRQAASDRFISRLQDMERRVRLAQDAGQIGVFEIDIASNVITASERFFRVFGLKTRPRLLASEIEALVVPEDKALVSSLQQRTLGDLQLISEYRIVRPDTGAIAWIARRAELVRGADGKALRMIGTVHDVTERKAAETKQNLLNDELSHRMKNTLSLVQAIASQTLRAAGDRTAVESFGQRVAALGRAHDVLLQGNWTSADLGTLIAKVLESHASRERFRLDGPPVRLGDKLTLSISMLIHELATNAIKYGSLSVEQGVVDINWRKDGDEFVLTWVEQGGPPVSEPTRRGLGSRLISMGLSGTGGVALSYTPMGFRGEFRAPIAMVEVP